MRSFHNKPSSYKAKRQTEQHEKRTENSCCNHFREHEKISRIHAHHLHGIYLFGNAHASYFRRYVRPHLSRKNQSNHRRTEFEYETLPYHISYIHLVNHRILQIGSSLDYQHSADKKRNDPYKKHRRQDKFV